jgi:uncharacterized protein YkwD
MDTKTRMPKYLLLLASATLLAAAQTSAQTQTETTSVSPIQTLFQLANQARAQHNLPPLQWDDALNKAAQAHLQWIMRNPGDLQHQYPGEPDLATRGTSAGAHFSSISENLGGHGDTAASLHQSWMNSPGHSGNLLDPNNTAVGIAVIEIQDKLYAVEDFSHGVAALTIDSVEQQVTKLLQARGFPPAPSNEDARKTCVMQQGQAGTPRVVIRWDCTDVSQLPDNVVQQLDKSKYTSAAVGACSAKQSGQFNTYHVAILLY